MKLFADDTNFFVSGNDFNLLERLAETELKVQMKCFFFIPEFERAAKIRKIAVYRFLISLLVPEL